MHLFDPDMREGMVHKCRITLSGDRQAVQLVLALGWQCVLLLSLDNRAGVAENERAVTGGGMPGG